MNLILAFVEDRRLGLAAMGALALTVGSALPWLYVPQPLIGSATGYGLQDEGKLTVLLGVLALVLLVAFARVRGRDLVVGAAACGLGAAGLAAYYTTRIPENAARVIARLLSERGSAARPERGGPVPGTPRSRRLGRDRRRGGFGGHLGRPQPPGTRKDRTIASIAFLTLWLGSSVNAS